MKKIIILSLLALVFFLPGSVMAQTSCSFISPSVSSSGGSYNFILATNGAIGCTGQLTITRTDMNANGATVGNQVVFRGAYNSTVSVSTTSAAASFVFDVAYSNATWRSPSFQGSGGGAPSSNSGTQSGPTSSTQIFSFDDPLGKGGILTDLVGVITFWAFNIALPIIVIVIIWAGIKLLASRGNPAKVGEAKTMLWWAVVGLAIIFVGRGFVELIKSILLLS